MTTSTDLDEDTTVTGWDVIVSIKEAALKKALDQVPEANMEFVSEAFLGLTEAGQDFVLQRCGSYHFATVRVAGAIPTHRIQYIPATRSFQVHPITTPA